MIIVISLADSELGHIRQYLPDNSKFTWVDKCVAILQKAINPPDDFEHDILLRKYRIDLSNVPGAANYIRNRTEIYEPYRFRSGAASMSIETEMNAEVEATMSKLDALAVNYHVDGIAMDADVAFASKFRGKVKTLLQGGISHHVNRVEYEKGRLDFEANGVKPGLLSVIDLADPGVLIQTDPKTWVDETLPPMILEP